MDRRTILKAAGVLACWTLPPVRAAAHAAGVSGLPGDGDDLAIVRAALALHPGLHRYLTPDEVEAGLAALGLAWADPALERRYLALSRFLAMIRCGHSHANYANQRDSVARQLFDRPTRLPFHFCWIDDAMVVTQGHDSGLAAGTVVTRINGERPVVLRRRLMPFVRADGHNDAKRIALLEVRGDETVETFDIFQGLIAPPPGGVHRLAIRTPDGRTARRDLPGIGLGARQRQRPASATSAPDAPAWQWTRRPDGVAVLTMPTWALYNSRWDWKGWLDSRLDSLTDARGLIVDLRANEGGQPCGDHLLRRWIRAPYQPPAFEQRLRFRRTPVALDPYLDTWDNSFRTLGEGARALDGGFFERPGADAERTILPGGRALACPLLVLTSPTNSSATFQFARDVRGAGVGQLVGRPTGGNRRGINGGAYFFVRLPHSGLEFDLPLVGYYATTREPDAGLLPDVAIRDSIASIAAGRDLTLERALALLGADTAKSI